MQPMPQVCCGHAPLLSPRTARLCVLALSSCSAPHICVQQARFAHQRGPTLPASDALALWTCSVIGDSFSFVAAIESLDAIVLSVVVQAAVAARQQSDGHGQTFHEVTCECGNTIGRRFSKHPQSRVHPILGYYTLDRTSIMSYELGSGITDASEVPNDFSAIVPRLPGEVGGVGAGAGQDVQAAVSDVQEDVAKVKAMTLLFDERLRAIEDLLRVCVCERAAAPSRKVYAADNFCILAKPIEPHKGASGGLLPHTKTEHAGRVYAHLARFSC